jgi:DNA-binding transcriptional LysR family regulator
VQVEYLKSAITVLQVGSYRAAAIALNLTDYAVACRVHKLEKELGYKLFKRGNSNGIRPTDQGVEYLFYARLALELLERGGRVAVEVGKNGKGA